MNTHGRSLLHTTWDILPGLLLAGVVAWLGLCSSEWLGHDVLKFEKSPISGIMMAIILGLVLGNMIALPAWLKSGIQFSLKWVLRLGIIFLGIRLSLGDVLRLGVLGIPLIVLCLVGGLLVARRLGAWLALSERMSILIAVGTSICGATAIVATGPAIDAKEEELTYAVANITVFGILAMLFYPFIAHVLLGNDPTSAGLFLGTAVHETAQVAGSGLIYDQLYHESTVLEAATVTKLVRNILMIAVIPIMAYAYQRKNQQGQAEKKIKLRSLFPTFILGFLLVALLRTGGDASLNSSGAAWWLLDESTWKTITDSVKTLSEILLAMAMAGVGLGTSVQQLRGLGLRPFYVGLAAALVVGIISLSGIAVMQILNLT